MELKEFVSNSLTQIIAGIQEAQAASVDTGAWINPAGSAITNKAGTPVIKTPDGQGYLHEIQFDVALTVSNDQKAGAGAGLRVLGASLGAKGEVTYQNQAVSRLQFSIPVVWPGQVLEELERKLKEDRDKKAAASESGRSSTLGWMAR